MLVGTDACERIESVALDGARTYISSTNKYAVNALVVYDKFHIMQKLYKWDNKAGTMKTPLKGKMFCLIASAYEDIGLNTLEKPFKLTAQYTGMKFRSL